MKSLKRVSLLLGGAVLLGGCNLLFGAGGGSDQVGDSGQSSAADPEASNLSAVNDQETGVGGGVETTGESDGEVASAGSYVNYSETAVAEATADDGKAVLFFHASWCPFCKAADKDINDRLSEIPSGVTIIKTDYDTQTQLKAKYEVVMQDTWVQVDGEGKMIKKWNGGQLDGVIENVI